MGYFVSGWIRTQCIKIQQLICCMRECMRILHGRRYPICKSNKIVRYLRTNLISKYTMSLDKVIKVSIFPKLIYKSNVI